MKNFVKFISEAKKHMEIRNLGLGSTLHITSHSRKNLKSLSSWRIKIHAYFCKQPLCGLVN